jgi:hypothetical protein
VGAPFVVAGHAHCLSWAECPDKSAGSGDEGVFVRLPPFRPNCATTTGNGPYVVSYAPVWALDSPG